MVYIIFKANRETPHNKSIVGVCGDHNVQSIFDGIRLKDNGGNIYTCEETTLLLERDYKIGGCFNA